MVNGTGFRELIRTTLEIGALHGNCSLDDLIPDRTTISRNLLSKADKVKVELVREIKEVS